MSAVHAFLFVRFRLWVAALCFVAGLRSLQGAGAEAIEPASLIASELPAWIRPPLALPPSPELSTTSPVRMMVVEEQVDVEQKAAFRHYALRVESESGLQSVGQVALSFSKDYETLRWHYLRVWRDGVKREVLTPEILQVLRQEEDADRFVYHGRMSVLAVLRDVRVGDTVEYAYTKVGANPVFGGRYSNRLAGAFGSPVERLSYRVIAAPDRSLQIAAHGGFRPSYRNATIAGRIEHEWTGADIAAIRSVGDAPGWEIQYPFVELTEFTSWAEVAAWGRELFAVPLTLGPELLERVNAVTQGLKTEEAKANAVLRFVQDEMRYLAVHLGESTHRPYAPDEVLRRRFGDCKDKSLLLVALLRHLGFEAHVALVDTDWGRKLNELQPSPLAFDHAIVHVRLPVRLRRKTTTATRFPEGRKLELVPQGVASEGDIMVFDVKLSKPPPLDGRLNPPANFPPPGGMEHELSPESLWLDATSTLQGGAFIDHHHGDFGHALILAPDSVFLRKVEPPTEPGNVVHVREIYTARKFDAPARLEVVTTYTGGLADLYRYFRRQSDPAQAAQQLTGVLGRFFPGVKSLGPVTWTDDREANTLVSHTSFDVPGFWTVESAGKVQVAEVYPWAISERLPRPGAMERSFSFGLPYPLKVLHEIEVLMPKDWPTATGHGAVEDGTFHFRWDSDTKGDRHHVTYEWRTRADSVPAKDIEAWSKKMTEVRNSLGRRLTQNIRLTAELKRTGVVWPLAFATVLGVIAGVALGLWLYRRYRNAPEEPPPLTPTGLVGLQGWLVLPAIGLVFRPFILVVGLWPTLRLVADHPAWVTFVDSESGGYIAGFVGGAVAEVLMGCLFAAWSVVLLVQFFGRKRSLPVSLVAYLISFPVWAAIHTVWFRQLPFATQEPLTSDVMDLVKICVPSAVWVPYFLVSRRVKLTFTRP